MEESYKRYLDEWLEEDMRENPYYEDEEEEEEEPLGPDDDISDEEEPLDDEDDTEPQLKQVRVDLVNV